MRVIRLETVNACLSGRVFLYGQEHLPIAAIRTVNWLKRNKLVRERGKMSSMTFLGITGNGMDQLVAAAIETLNRTRGMGSYMKPPKKGEFLCISLRCC